LLPYTPAQWKRFFELASAPQHAADPRFVDPVKRSENINQLYAILADLVAKRTTAEWQALLKEADIPMAPILSPDDLLEDPHLRATGFFAAVEHPTEGKLRSVGIPVTFSRTPGGVRWLAPRLDQDGPEIRAAVAAKKPTP
jgi:crotonobetainyl-CoA:carnitine CoA-transferase CaiB-like acyl-CoA transferase